MFQPTIKTKCNGIPILTKGELDEIGEYVAGDFCSDALRTPTAIDVDRLLTRYCGLKQDFHYLSHNGLYLGMIVFNDSNRVVIFDKEAYQADYISVKAGTVIIDTGLLEDNQEHRYRYTVVHECGHGLLHKDVFYRDPNQLSMLDSQQEPIIQCRRDSKAKPVRDFGKWTSDDWMEWQANRFSSAVLMPRCMVKKLADEIVCYEKGILRTMRMVTEVSKAFNVSFDAAEYRLIDMGYINRDEAVAAGTLRTITRAMGY